MLDPTLAAAARELAPMLVVTGVIGSDRSMRWTSPLTGTCYTLYETGVATLSSAYRSVWLTVFAPTVSTMRNR